MELWKEKVLCDKNCIQWDSEFVLSLFFLSFLSGKGIYCLSVLWRTLNILLCLSLFKISAVTIKWEKLTGSIPRSSAVYVFIWLLKNLYKINIFGFIVGIHYFFCPGEKVLYLCTVGLRVSPNQEAGNLKVSIRITVLWTEEYRGQWGLLDCKDTQSLWCKA